MHVYRLTSEAQTFRWFAGVVAILSATGMVWMALASEDPVTRILFLAGGIWLGWGALRLGLSLLSMKPTLTLSDEGIRASGYAPASNPGNWSRTLLWNEVSQAKVEKIETVIKGPLSTAKVRTVNLNFYARDDQGKPIAVLPLFDKFEKQEEIVQLIGEKLGQPVLEESVQKT